MDSVDAISAAAQYTGTGIDIGSTADELAGAPLLNCLLREIAEPVAPGAFRLRASGRLLRTSGGRRPVRPELRAADGRWRLLDHTGLVELTSDELRRFTSVPNDELPGEILDSRDVLAALLTARAATTPPDDPYLRSEQSLVTGHPYHPAPKARGGGPVTAWLPYAPEAYARFPLELLAVREDVVVEEGDTGLLDALGEAPPGYRLLPAHPWQLDLVGARPEVRDAFADGRLLRLGRGTRLAWPTAAIRTLYVPADDLEDDLFVKFSLDVRITNDIRRLWRHDLRGLRRTDSAVTAAAATLPRSAWLSDRGYRTASFAFEELAVLVRDGLRQHIAPGTTPLLAAWFAESHDGGLPGNLTDPVAWWEAYLRCVVPPALELFARHGVVLEAHLQNTVVAVDPAGIPAQALFRDAEGVKLLTDVKRAAGWERLVYCLVVNNLTEIANALAERYPQAEPALWPAVRRELGRHGEIPEISALLDAPTLPGKTNLLLRWTGADGADARYLPLANPLRNKGT
jgi:siderophore synthetase component